MSDQELVERIERVRFTPSRLREGYDMGDVDTLLDHLVQAVRAGEPLGPIVDLVRLRTTKLREGYDQAEVDDFLATLSGAPAGTATDAVAAAPGGPAVVQEQKGLLARLLGR